MFAIAGLVGRHRVAQNGVKLREGTSPSISRRSRSARDVSASRSEESRKSGKRRSFAVMHNSMDAKEKRCKSIRDVLLPLNAE